MTNDEARQTLVHAIRDSGMTIMGFAVRRLGRDPSALYRWLSKEQEIPEVVCRWLDHNYLNVDGKYGVAEMYDEIMERVEEARGQRIGDLVKMAGGDAGYDEGYRAGVLNTLTDVAHMLEELQNV